MQKKKTSPHSQLFRTMRVLVILSAVLVVMICVLSSCQEPSGEEPPVTTTEPVVTTTEPEQTAEPTTTEPTTTAPADTTPPEISGAEDILAYMGDAVSYRSGVTVTDDTDPAPKLNIDSTAVDLSTPGSYQVLYSATDAAGNVTTLAVEVKVMEKKEEYASLETIYAMADERLAQIITEDMTTRQQVKAIYSWARRSFGYSGHSDKSDWLQGAYVMMTDGAGDCFNYYAVCKLMFERLGIENIDVRKVKNYDGDSDHFWSLVSVDGGETYYHFDATPRTGSGDDFCLVTDAFLDAYSAAHKKCHNRDKSLYPATPEE